jgi:glycogen debranching enzyme
VEKYKDFSGWSHCNGLPKYKNFSRDDMIGLEGALFKRWKLKRNEGS